MSEEKERQNHSNEAKGGINKLYIIIGTVIILLLIAVIVILLLKNKKQASDNVGRNQTGAREVAESARLVLDESSAQNVLDEMRQEVKEGMFECNMSMTWTFPDGKSSSKDAIVVNSSNNTYPIYFDVELEDTGDVVYSSPVIPIGSQLTDFALDKELNAGEYKAVVMYSLLEDEESQAVKSQAGFVITIIVEN